MFHQTGFFLIESSKQFIPAQSIATHIPHLAESNRGEESRSFGDQDPSHLGGAAVLPQKDHEVVDQWLMKKLGLNSVVVPWLYSCDSVKI